MTPEEKVGLLLSCRVTACNVETLEESRRGFKLPSKTVRRTQRHAVCRVVPSVTLRQVSC
jgi:hypothetical protein